MRRWSIKPTQELTSQSHPTKSPKEIMAFQRADPRPFMSLGMIWEDIPNHPLMVCVVASFRAQPRNENMAIATINPLLGNAPNFTVVREVLREFFEREHVHILDI